MLLCPSGYFLPPAQEDHDLCRECPSGWSTHERKGQSECVSDAQVSILENQDMLRHIKNDPSQIYFVVKFNVAGNLTDERGWTSEYFGAPKTKITMTAKLLRQQRLCKIQQIRWNMRQSWEMERAATCALNVVLRCACILSLFRKN